MLNKLLLLLTGSPQLDATGSSGCRVASSSYTFTIVCSGGSPKPGIIAGVACLTVGGTVSSISSDLIGSFTKALAASNGLADSEIWYLAAPAVGTHTLTVTLSGAITSDSAAASYFAVDQSSPIGVTGSNTGTGTNISDAISTGTDGSFVFDHVATSNKTLVATSPSVERWNTVCVPGSGAASDQGLINPAGAVTMAWTGIGALDVWAHTMAEIKPYIAPSTSFTAIIRRTLGLRVGSRTKN